MTQSVSSDLTQLRGQTRAEEWSAQKIGSIETMTMAKKDFRRADERVVDAAAAAAM